MNTPVSLFAPAPIWGWGLLLPHLGYSRCYRCRRPWWAAQLRDVDYTPCRGQFALCKRCWDRSDVLARLNAHAWVTAGWEDAGDRWPTIRDAVWRDSPG